jgi:hypothetical protein
MNGKKILMEIAKWAGWIILVVQFAIENLPV